MTTLTFQNTTLSVINQNNQTWLTASEISKALDYARADLVLRLYDRHQDEFTPNMTALIDMRTNGGMQKVRIFSLRGCHLIGMLSHTKVAKDFRKWVLDILDRETAKQQQLALPEPEPKFTFEFTEHELQQLTWAWFALLRCAEMCKVLEPALRQIGSHYAATVHDLGCEYGYTIRQSHNTLNRITEKFICEQSSNWRVLKYLRNYNPKKTGFQLDIL